MTALVACYAAWMGMLATHELGHMIGAWVTGGRVVDVSVPLLGLSQTIVHPNPREHVVVWCGPIIGVLLPVALLSIKRVAPTSLGFFVGFCLIANGAYIGVGWMRRAGDAGDLVRLGTPVWAMMLFGVICVSAGMLCWHRTPGLSLPALLNADAAIAHDRGHDSAHRGDGDRLHASGRGGRDDARDG